MTYDTREAWLIDAVKALTPLFEELDETVPALRVSVGWPGGKGKKSTTIGQCWAPTAAKDGTAQIFISPVKDDALDVLGILAHEMVHAVDGCESGHKGRFTRIARGIGLAGKLTATVPGDDLRERLVNIASTLGDYPHSALTPSTGKTTTQTTRMIKIECPDCGYICRTTQKWLDIGLPTCPYGTEMEVAP